MATQVQVPGGQSDWTDSDVNKIAAAAVELQGINNGSYLPFSALAPTATPFARSISSLGGTVVTAFQSGHGWTSTGASATNLNDTTDGLLSGQSVKVTSNGAGGAVTVRKLGMTAFSVSGKSFLVWIKVDDITHLFSMQIYVGDTSFTNFKVYQVFNSLPNMAIRSGEWFPVLLNANTTVSTTGSPNLASITDMQIRYTDDNTGNAVVVHCGGIGLIPDPTAYTNGVVTFDFDDCYASTYTNALPKLAQYGYSASTWVIRDLIDSSSTYMTLANLRDLETKYGWDVGAHSDNVADHNASLSTLTSAQLETNLQGIKGWLLSNGFRAADHFVYPHGGQADYSDTTQAAIRRYFASARLTQLEPRQVWPPADPYRILCYPVNNGIATATVTAEIDKAFTNKNWLRLLFHKLVTSGASGASEYLIADFNTIVDYCATKGIAVRTTSEVLAGR